MPRTEAPLRLPNPRRMTVPLCILAVVVGVATVVGVGLMVHEHLALGRVGSPTFPFLVLALVMGGLSIVTLMLGLAAAIHYAHRLSLSVRRIEYRDELTGNGAEASSEPEKESPAPIVPAPVEAQGMDEILRLLRDISEHSLLTDEQKQAKLVRRRNEERRGYWARIEQFVLRGDFHLARQVCREAVERFGEDPEIARAEGEIEKSRAAAEASDFAEARRKVADLMSISAWQRAEQVAGELAAKHPDNQQARELLTSIGREQATFEQQQRRRMYADIQKYTSRRQWKEALSAGKLLVDRYGNSAEADAVRAQLETLEANAEIQERQTQEQEIKDLIKKHRFTEAVSIAKHLIQKYPDSPQAEVLRSQLGRLEEKAKKTNGVD